MTQPLFCLCASFYDVTARSLDQRFSRRGCQGPPLTRRIHSLEQVAGDIFEDLVILLGEAAQNVLHRLEALLPIVDL